MKYDRFFTLADYDAYILAQEKVSKTYKVDYIIIRTRESNTFYLVFILVDVFKCHLYLLSSRDNNFSVVD